MKSLDVLKLPFFFPPFTQQIPSLSCFDTSHVWIELVSVVAANVPFLHYWEILLVKDNMSW